MRNGYARLVVTRGPGHLGLTPDGCGPANVIIIADAIQLYPEEFYENGLKIITVPTRRINSSALPPCRQELELPEQHFGKDRGQASRLPGSFDAQ